MWQTEWHYYAYMSPLVIQCVFQHIHLPSLHSPPLKPYLHPQPNIWKSSPLSLQTPTLSSSSLAIQRRWQQAWRRDVGKRVLRGRRVGHYFELLQWSPRWGYVTEEEGVQTTNNPFEEKAKENSKTSKKSLMLTIISSH